MDRSIGQREHDTSAHHNCTGTRHQQTCQGQASHATEGKKESSRQWEILFRPLPSNKHLMPNCFQHYCNEQQMQNLSQLTPQRAKMSKTVTTRFDDMGCHSHRNCQRQLPQGLTTWDVTPIRGRLTQDQLLNNGPSSDGLLGTFRQSPQGSTPRHQLDHSREVDTSSTHPQPEIDTPRLRDAHHEQSKMTERHETA
jgi:hypothetical protein